MKIYNINLLFVWKGPFYATKNIGQIKARLPSSSHYRLLIIEAGRFREASVLPNISHEKSTKT